MGNQKKNWKLVWSDEFDSPEINKENWGFELGYIRNNELQKYTDDPKNAYIEDGCLVIEAIKTDEPDCPYTSASLNTKDKVNFTHGRLEMRAKLPYGTGIWPAFWTLGQDIDENPWPSCGEIDIMELVGGNNDTYATCPFNDHHGDHVVQATIHFKGEPEGHILPRAYELMEGDFKDDFHVFGVDWDENCAKFYIDGVYYNKCNISDIPELHRPQYVLVNIAVGGGWPGDPDENTVFPQKYYIDYIRYYKEEK